MSLARWQPYTGIVSVEESPNGRLLVRPRRLSLTSGILIGTNIAAGLAVSAAVVRVQTVGLHPDGSIAAAFGASIVFLYGFRNLYLNHPDRGRFVGWWLAIVLARLTFTDVPALQIFPLEHLVLAPAYRAATGSATLTALSLTGMAMTKADIAFVKFVEADFSRADLVEAEFTGVDFERCRFVGVGGRKVRFRECTFKECDFSEADLSGSEWEAGSAMGCVFARANLSEAAFDAIDLRKANFEGADLRGTQFPSGYRCENNLDGAKLTGARFDARTRWTEFAMPTRSGAVKID